jgi:hypothetical protein
MDQSAEQRERSCYAKARAAGMPSFTLIAQDCTSDLVLDFWISASLEVRQAMDDGLTLVEAIAQVRASYHASKLSSGAVELLYRGAGGSETVRGCAHREGHGSMAEPNSAMFVSGDGTWGQPYSRRWD